MLLSTPTPEILEENVGLAEDFVFLWRGVPREGSPEFALEEDVR